MKSSKSAMNINLKRVGILSLMVLSLSVGTVRGASEFKLWHESTSADSAGPQVKHMTEDSDKESSVKWLVKEASTESVEKFIKKFSKEPFMFVEGLKEAITAAKKDGKLDTLKKTIEEKMFSKNVEGFKDSDSKEAFRKLSEALFKLDKIDESFLEKLFKDKKLILAALNLTQVEPNTSPSPSASPKASTSPVASPVVSPRDTGEQFDDAALRGQAQRICDNLNGKDQANKALQEQINSMKDALNDAFNKLAEASTQAPQNQNARKNEKGLEDILPGLLANALNQEKPQEITPAQNPQQQFPQQQSKNNTDPSAFNQPLPDQGQVPQQPNMPMPQMPANNNFGPVKLDLPATSSVTRQMNDADASKQDITKAEATVKSATAMASDPMTMSNPMMATMALQKLGEAKGEMQNAVELAETRLTTAKKAQQQLQEQLDELKDGARSALPDSVKRKMSELEKAVTDAKSQQQYQQQVTNMLAPEQRQMAMGDVTAANQKVQAAESALNQYKSEVDIALEQGNAKIAALKRKSQNLDASISDLEGKVNSGQKKIGDLDTAITTVRNQILQSQMQPNNGGAANVNKLNGFGGSSNGGSRTPAPRIGTSLQSSPSSATGGDVRGSLGAKR